jgi:hypothetical protein
MRRRTEEKAPKTHVTSWADIAAKGTGETGKFRVGAESGAQHDAQTELVAMNAETISKEHLAERRLMLQEEQGLPSVSRLGEISSSEPSVPKASTTLVLTQAEVDRMECSTVVQEEETIGTRLRQHLYNKNKMKTSSRMVGRGGVGTNCCWRK